jgi:hypothetical protein
MRSYKPNVYLVCLLKDNSTIHRRQGVPDRERSEHLSKRMKVRFIATAKLVFLAIERKRAPSLRNEDYSVKRFSLT